MKEKIAIGLSGGVDSAVAAWLLKKEGYEVIGLTMETGIPEVTEDARRVADQLGIRHECVDVKQSFQNEVMDYFVNEYLEGRTPNPCIKCNQRIKWQALIAAAEGYGAHLFATGHYANVLQLANGRYTVKMCDYAAKDQTYVLYQLSQNQLQRTRMPLGHYEKKEIRAMAEQLQLSVADKPESMDICFIPDNDYSSFIERECVRCGKKVPAEGNFVDIGGTVLGKHKGIHHYTVGQRKGLGVALGYPAFVCKIIPETDTVVLGTNDDIFSDRVVADKVNWVGLPPMKEGQTEEVTARIRYNHAGAKAVLHCMDNERIECVFESPQRAVTPGQSLVAYKDDWVAVGGRIIAYEKPGCVSDK